uniref:Bm1195 n=1 Tax=Brugia malayi TaxID=6279 RepID=A0A1I9GCC9_BRUMA|nr:Bm1195 [Brugia malayi]
MTNKRTKLLHAGIYLSGGRVSRFHCQLVIVSEVGCI